MMSRCLPADAAFTRKLTVVLFCTAVAAAYGILHDEITIRICVSYFTVAHPSFFPTANLTLLALWWGIAGTAWLGAALGLALAIATQSVPPALPRAVDPSVGAPIALPRIWRAVLRLVCAMAISAVAVGSAAFALSRRVIISLPRALASAIPEKQHDAFAAVWFAHIASYGVALVGGALLIYYYSRARGSPRVLPLFPVTTFGAIRAGLLAGVAAIVIYLRFGPS